MTAIKHRSNQLYLGLVALLALLTAVNIFLPQGERGWPEAAAWSAFKPMDALVTAVLMVTIYGGLGWLGLLYARKLGFPELWDVRISTFHRLGLPALAGLGLGILFMFADLVLSRSPTWRFLPHPPFPTALVASGVAGIGEEIIFRLFFIPFWFWLLSTTIGHGRRQQALFWLVAVWSALAFAFGHLPALMALLGVLDLGAIPLPLLGEILLLNSLLSLLAAFYLRTYGFLAAVSLHFWTDLVWHIMGGLVG